MERSYRYDLRSKKECRTADLPSLTSLHNCTLAETIVNMPNGVVASFPLETQDTEDSHAGTLVCVPLSTARLPDVVDLYRTIMHSSNLLPPEWICSLVSNRSLALYKLFIARPMSADFSYMLTVSVYRRFLDTVHRQKPIQCQP